MRKEWYLLIDLFFYFLFPFVIWETCRQFINDYLAIILSVLPGIVYSLYRLFHSMELNFTRMFLLANIIGELIVNLFSGSALQLLWNLAFYSLGLAILYLVSCFINKPLFLYFALDILVTQGYDRNITKEMLKETNSLSILKIMTITNSINQLSYAILLMLMISIKGIEAYSYSMIMEQILNLAVSVISVCGFYFIYKNINEIKLVHQIKSHGPRRKKVPKLSYLWVPNHYESNYFFLSNQ
jgi:peptidoglycan/LPS O-acetylase OafA/YrhL